MNDTEAVQFVDKADAIAWIMDSVPGDWMTFREPDPKDNVKIWTVIYKKPKLDLDNIRKIDRQYYEENFGKKKE